MKKLKTLKTLVFIIILGFLSCNTDEDAPLNPGDDRDKFLGTWSVTETCMKSNFNVIISKDPGNSAQVLLANFGNPGPNYAPATGLVAGNKIFVANQEIGDGWMITGTGNLQENSIINWTYTLSIAGNSFSCSAEFRK